MFFSIQSLNQKMSLGQTEKINKYRYFNKAGKKTEKYYSRSTLDILFNSKRNIVLFGDFKILK